MSMVTHGGRCGWVSLEKAHFQRSQLRAASLVFIAGVSMVLLQALTSCVDRIVMLQLSKKMSLTAAAAAGP